MFATDLCRAISPNNDIAVLRAPDAYLWSFPLPTAVKKTWQFTVAPDSPKRNRSPTTQFASAGTLRSRIVQRSQSISGGQVDVARKFGIRHLLVLDVPVKAVAVRKPIAILWFAKRIYQQKMEGRLDTNEFNMCTKHKCARQRQMTETRGFGSYKVTAARRPEIRVTGTGNWWKKRSR